MGKAEPPIKHKLPRADKRMGWSTFLSRVLCSPIVMLERMLLGAFAWETRMRERMGYVWRDETCRGGPGYWEKPKAAPISELDLRKWQQRNEEKNMERIRYADPKPPRIMPGGPKPGPTPPASGSAVKYPPSVQ